MKTRNKWNVPMAVSAAVIALGVFLLLSLITYERYHYEHADTLVLSGFQKLFFVLSDLQFGILGGAAYFLVTIALAWAVIVFFRERDGEMLVRGAGTAVLVCASATLFALWGNDYLGGSLGAGIASVLRTFPGVILGSVLMSAVFVASFIAATDWLFYSALREAVSGSDLMRDAGPGATLPAVYERPEPEVAEESEPAAAVATIQEEEPTAEFADDPDEPEEAEDRPSAVDPAPAEETEDRVMVTPAEPKATEAATEVAVPAALRAALGAGRGTIEVEPSDVEFAEGEAPAVAAPESEEGVADEDRVVVTEKESAEPRTEADDSVLADAPEDSAAEEEEPELERAEDETDEIEAEETAAVLADEPEEGLHEDEVDEEEKPAAEAVPPTAPETPISGPHVEIGHRGHRIEVEPSDVEFAEPENHEVVPYAAGPYPSIVDEETIFVDEEAMSRMAPASEPPGNIEEGPQPPAAETQDAVEDEPEPTTAEAAADVPAEPAAEAPELPAAELSPVPDLIEERANLRRDPEPDPDVTEMPEAHLGMVLEDEEIVWGGHADDEPEEPAPAPVEETEEEPAAIDEEVILDRAPEPPPPPAAERAEEEPEPETAPEAGPPAGSEPETKEEVATSRMAGVLDSLLGPAPEPAPEPETLVALADEDEEEEPPTEAAPDAADEVEIEAEEEETPVDEEIVDRPATADLDIRVDETVEEEPGTDEDAPERSTGLLGWFRRRRIEEVEPEERPTRSPVRARRRESETPSLFDREPGGSEPDAELVDRAARLAIETGRASIVLFQRKLSVGYHRARALVDRLVNEGVLGPMGETGSHPVLVSEEAWEARRSTVA